MKIIRTDNGGEFTSTEFEHYLREEGIKHKYTIPKTLQQNGVSERMNRTLVEAVRSMLVDAKLPHRLWAEALSTAAYLVNRSHTKALGDKTPFEAWYGKKPSVEPPGVLHTCMWRKTRGRNSIPGLRNASSSAILLRGKAIVCMTRRNQV